MAGHDDPQRTLRVNRKAVQQPNEIGLGLLEPLLVDVGRRGTLLHVVPQQRKRHRRIPVVQLNRLNNKLTHKTGVLHKLIIRLFGLLTNLLILRALQNVKQLLEHFLFHVIEVAQIIPYEYSITLHNVKISKNQPS